MEIKEEKEKDLFVTLNMEDGSSLECRIMASFPAGSNTYAALLPVDEKGNPMLMAQIMLYRMEEDQDHNPIVVYIDDDMEYEVAAKELSKLLNHQ